MLTHIVFLFTVSMLGYTPEGQVLPVDFTPRNVWTYVFEARCEGCDPATLEDVTRGLCEDQRHYEDGVLYDDSYLADTPWVVGKKAQLVPAACIRVDFTGQYPGEQPPSAGAPPAVAVVNPPSGCKIALQTRLVRDMPTAKQRNDFRKTLSVQTANGTGFDQPTWNKLCAALPK